MPAGTRSTARATSIALALTVAITVVDRSPATAAPVLPVARSAEAVVLQGAQLPGWADAPAEGAAAPWPNGAVIGGRDAHAGTLVAPPHTVGVPVERIAAFRWEGTRFVEVPVQVDERFPYFLQNRNSSFSLYSGTDEELSYEWDVESWLKTAGECFAEYPQGVEATEDPVPTLDADDEITFMASDAGGLAPPDALGPAGTDGVRQQIAIADPLDPANVRFMYLFLRAGGSSFTRHTGYVDYRRDADADEWIDRYSIPHGDPEMLGTSNRGYGPNLSGTVCRTAQEPPGTDYPQVPDGQPRPSTDRFPRDGVTVSTDAYRWHASGRWMVRSIQVAKPGQPAGCVRSSAGCTYGPDLIDRWKGRAFQSSPDSSISEVGFEDEQVNWEANSALIGELAGPVRAIRETWGADSGTNVTKTEIFYRDAIAYRFRVRVHPIPPDGLYQSWDYNAGVASTFYNVLNPNGVAIDGQNDDTGNVDEIAGRPAFFDAPDPTFSPLSSIGTWEQVSGAGDAGSLVYTNTLNSPTTLANPAVVPYYRDDACFDDGTGDDPVPRPWPGEASSDPRVIAGYEAANGGTPYAQLTCDQKQGAWGAHGIHYLFAPESDNAFMSKPVNEIDATMWQIAVPTAAPTNVAQRYATTIIEPLVPIAAPLSTTPAIATDITYTGDTSAQATDDATLAAHLEDEDGTPLAGQTVRFDFRGDTHEATTDEDGNAEVPVTVNGPAGTYDVEVTYDGAPPYEGSSDRATIEVVREDTTLDVWLSGRPNERRVNVSLTETDTGSGLADRPVDVTIGGDPAGTITTGSDGIGSMAIPKIRKDTPIGVRFAGDDTFEPAETSIVYRG